MGTAGPVAEAKRTPLDALPTPTVVAGGLFSRIGRGCARHRAAVIVAWVVAALTLGAFASRLSDALTPGGFEIAGSPSEEARSLILDRFARDSPTTLAPVLTPRSGATPTRDEYAAVAAAITRTLRTQPAVRDVGPLQVASNGRSAFMIVGLSAGIDESLREADDLVGLARTAATSSVGVEVTGGPAVFSDFDTVNEEDIRRAEIIQAPLVLLVLILVLGSLIAAGLPIVATGAALLITLGGLYFAAQATSLSIYVRSIVLLIGIGVCVDYSLFLINRFREERRAGRPVAEAVAVMTATSGRAIFYSGLTVAVALAGMFAVGVPIFTGLAIGTISVVAVSVAAALTFIPALLAALGDRVFGVDLGSRLTRLARRRNVEGGWIRWSEHVMCHPWPYALASSVVLLALAIPALWMDLGSSGATALPRHVPSIQAADVVARQIGPGGLAPHRIVVDGDGAPPPTTGVEQLRRRLLEDPDITSVGPIQPSDDGNAVLFDAVPRYGEDDERVQDSVARIERTYVPATTSLGTSRVFVGGVPVQNRDFNRTVADNTPRVISLVMVLTFLVLLVLFRSVLLPFKAVVMTLFSALCAYGVLVMVFQWGWGDGLLGFDHLGHVTAWVPPFLFSILFGLSMDYEVFLLTRVREHYDVHGDDRAAVAWGLARSGAIITAAASIMIIVFLSFVGNRLIPLKETALGLAVAVFVDATLVRVILVPAFMRIAGRGNWWLPRWLARICPHRTPKER